MKVESVAIKFLDRCEACGWISVGREHCANNLLKGKKWLRKIPDISTTPEWCPLDDIPVMSGADVIKILKKSLE